MISAVQWTGFNLSELERLIEGSRVAIGGVTITSGPDGWVSIRTLEGTMRADVNDWIIRGVAGELYPCKPDIFEATYEEVGA